MNSYFDICFGDMIMGTIVAGDMVIVNARSTESHNRVSYKDFVAKYIRNPDHMIRYAQIEYKSQTTGNVVTDWVLLSCIESYDQVYDRYVSYMENYCKVNFTYNGKWHTDGIIREVQKGINSVKIVVVGQDFSTTLDFSDVVLWQGNWTNWSKECSKYSVGQVVMCKGERMTINAIEAVDYKGFLHLDCISDANYKWYCVDDVELIEPSYQRFVYGDTIQVGEYYGTVVEQRDGHVTYIAHGTGLLRCVLDTYRPLLVDWNYRGIKVGQVYQTSNADFVARNGVWVITNIGKIGRTDGWPIYAHRLDQHGHRTGEGTYLRNEYIYDLLAENEEQYIAKLEAAKKVPDMYKVGDTLSYGNRFCTVNQVITPTTGYVEMWHDGSIHLVTFKEQMGKHWNVHGIRPGRSYHFVGVLNTVTNERIDGVYKVNSVDAPNSRNSIRVQIFYNNYPGYVVWIRVIHSVTPVIANNVEQLDTPTFKNQLDNILQLVKQKGDSIVDTKQDIILLLKQVEELVMKQ